MFVHNTRYAPQGVKAGIMRGMQVLYLCNKLTVNSVILWTHLTPNIFATDGRIHMGFTAKYESYRFLDYENNGENPVRPISCMVSEKPA